jgi:hypothetical protein
VPLPAWAHADFAADADARCGDVLLASTKDGAGGKVSV